MDAGVIVAEGSPAELIGRHSTREVLELRFAPDDRPEPSALGVVGLSLLGHLAYFAVMIVLGVALAARRLGALLLS